MPVLALMVPVIAFGGLRKSATVGQAMIFGGAPVVCFTPFGLCGRSDGSAADKPVI
ncbi:MAG: hypothetical protein AAF293_14315 [Pseudomonadota bacterium]